MITTDVANPYWDAVKAYVNPKGSLWRTPEVDPYSDQHGMRTVNRHELCSRYSWTIPDPDSIAFVVEHSAGRVVDPMAGTGYWAHLLAANGVDVVAYDLEPGTSHWHEGVDLHHPIEQADGREAVTRHADRTLLLSWPPYDKPTGVEILRAYPGNRLVYMGEAEGGCCGDDDLFAEMESAWTQVAERVPVQWFSIHDVITVWDRKQPA